MPIHTNLDRASQLAKEARLAGGQQEQGKQTISGCLVLIVLAFLCWGGVALMMPPQPDTSIQEVCNWQEMVGGDSCTPERVLRDYRPMVDACYDVWSAANTDNIMEWINCLKNKSVDLID